MFMVFKKPKAIVGVSQAVSAKRIFNRKTLEVRRFPKLLSAKKLLKTIWSQIRIKGVLQENPLFVSKFLIFMLCIGKILRTERKFFSRRLILGTFLPSNFSSIFSLLKEVLFLGLTQKLEAIHGNTS